MVVATQVLIFCITLGVQGLSPFRSEGLTSLNGFEDVNAEAIVVEAEDRERSGRQLSNSIENVDSPLLYKFVGGFQPGIVGWHEESGSRGHGAPTNPKTHWTPDNSPWNPKTTKSTWESTTTSRSPWTPDNSPWNPSTTKSPWKPPTKSPWTPDNSPWNPSTTAVWPPPMPTHQSTTTRAIWTPPTTTASSWKPSTTTVWPPPLPTHPSTTTRAPWTPPTTTVSSWKPPTQKPSTPWPGAGGIPGGWPPAIPTHPPTTTRAPWKPPTTTKSPWNSPTTSKYPWTQPTQKPTNSPKAPPASVGTQQCGVGKYGAIRYNAQGEVAEEINRINGTHPFRVVNGWPADKHEWPWIAALLNNGRQFCGGSLIDDRHILTAAHCVAHMSRYDVANLKIRLGAHYIKRAESGTHESEVARVVRHKGFSQQTLHWDVAIITMKTPAPSNNPKIRPVCLDTGSQQYAGETATVTGWGSLMENGPQPEELMEVTVKIWNNGDCKSTYGPNAPGGIEPYMLCAGKKGKDSCSGDSGGPMVKGKGSTWAQIGIVSWGIGCGKSHYPGVYTRVAAVQDWIQKIIKDY